MILVREFSTLIIFSRLIFFKMNIIISREAFTSLFLYVLEVIL